MAECFQHPRVGTPVLIAFHSHQQLERKMRHAFLLKANMERNQSIVGVLWVRRCNHWNRHHHAVRQTIFWKRKPFSSVTYGAAQEEKKRRGKKTEKKAPIFTHQLCQPTDPSPHPRQKYNNNDIQNQKHKTIDKNKNNNKKTNNTSPPPPLPIYIYIQQIAFTFLWLILTCGIFFFFDVISTNKTS